MTPPTHADITHPWHPATDLDVLKQRVDDLTFAINHLARRLNVTIDYFVAALGADEEEAHRWINDKAAE